MKNSLIIKISEIILPDNIKIRQETAIKRIYWKFEIDKLKQISDFFKENKITDINNYLITDIINE